MISICFLQGILWDTVFKSLFDIINSCQHNDFSWRPLNVTQGVSRGGGSLCTPFLLILAHLISPDYKLNTPLVWVAVLNGSSPLLDPTGMIESGWMLPMFKCFLHFKIIFGFLDHISTETLFKYSYFSLLRQRHMFKI